MQRENPVLGSELQEMNPPGRLAPAEFRQHQAGPWHAASCSSGCPVP